MARRPPTRLVLVGLAVAALASCGKDDPEPVSAGGLELASTTTEQPDVPGSSTTTTTTRPRPTTTTSTTTTSTTTTTTTTAPPPVIPTAEELGAILPGSGALAAGEWSRTVGPTAAAGTPAPLCDGSDVVSPLAPIIYDGGADGGASASYRRPDESTRVLLVVAPLIDGEAQLAVARTAVEGCGSSASPVNVLGWPDVGDGSIAYSRTMAGPVGDPPVPGGQIAAWAIARVGPLVVTLNVLSFWADGQVLAPAPTEGELQAFFETAVAAVAALTPPPAVSG